MLASLNDSMLHYDDSLRNQVSPQYRNLASMARTGLKQALMKTDLSASVQDSQVMAIHPTADTANRDFPSDGVVVDFFVQMNEQQDEEQLKSKLYKSLEATNFVLGDSEIVAARFTDSLTADDFDECSQEGHNDCHESATCLNEPGSYRCECNDGYIDASDNSGRVCLGMIFALFPHDYALCRRIIQLPFYMLN